MADYLEAYMAANSREPEIRLLYANGWVLFRNRESYISFDRKRMREVVEMTLRLKARAAQGMEARSAETLGSAVGDSPVSRKADAPDPLPPIPQSQTESAA
jgi:hypothetical protein